MKRWLPGVWMVVAALLARPALAQQAILETTDGGAPVPLTGTVWRVWEVYATEVCQKADGSCVAVDPFDPRQVAEGGGYALKVAANVRHSALPDAKWTAPDFDDTLWSRRMTCLLGPYRGLAALCLRGKFTVDDPAAAGDLALKLDFQGGVVVYLNGAEVGRSHLPPGGLTAQSLAQAYPPEAYFGPGGEFVALSPANYRPNTKDAAPLEAYARRRRTLALTIPAKHLRQGGNVLAIEVRRAPAHEPMFTRIASKQHLDNHTRAAFWWNRAAVESLRLTAAGGGIAPNAARPAGVQVWALPPYERPDAALYGDPNDPPAALDLYGARNGICTGQLVVSADKPLGELKVTYAPAGGGQGALPASWVQVRFPRTDDADWRRWRFDRLDVRGDPALPVQPIWLTVQVPRDAPAGDYAGAVTVQAGPQRFAVPLRVHVADWTLPDPTDFTTHVGLVQSPESLALRYDVPMWSDKHWALIDESFRLQALVGNQSLYLPLIRQSHFGNDQTMVRWIRPKGAPAQGWPEGGFTHDFALVERYVASAVKHLGKLPVVVLYCYEGGNAQISMAERLQALVTEQDASTGQLREAAGPSWGDEHARAFWKPVIDGVGAILDRHGLRGSMMVGIAGDADVNLKALEDLKAIAPAVPWVCHAHRYREYLGNRSTSQPVGYMAAVGGACSVFWDPQEHPGFLGWRNPLRVVSFPRDGFGAYAGPSMHQWAEPNVFRVCAEGTLLAGRQTKYVTRETFRVDSVAAKADETCTGLHGLGRLGADFFPVVAGRTGPLPVCGRYPRSDWGTVSIARVLPALLAPGADGPVASVRLELLRQSLQEAQAHIALREALLQARSPAAPHDDFHRRAAALLAQRARVLRQISEAWDGWYGRYLLPPEWDRASRELYELAGRAPAASK